MATNKKDLLTEAIEGSKEALEKLVHGDLVNRAEMELIRLKGKTGDVREFAAKFLKTKTEQSKRRIRQFIMLIIFLGIVIIGWQMYPKVEAWFTKQITPTETKMLTAEVPESKSKEPVEILNSPEINKNRFIEGESSLEDTTRYLTEMFDTHYGILNCEDFYFNNEKNKTEWICATIFYKGDTIKGNLSFVGFQGAITIKLHRVSGNNFAGTWKMMYYESKLEAEIKKEQLELSLKSKDGGIANATLRRIR